MQRGLAYRRHQRRRIMAKRKHYWGRWPSKKDKKRLGMLVKTPNPVTNPWKAYRGPSKQEILARIREQEQIEDFYTNLGAY